MNKREFLRSAVAASVGLTLADVSDLFASVAETPVADLAQDEVGLRGIVWVKSL